MEAPNSPMASAQNSGHAVDPSTASADLNDICGDTDGMANEEEADDAIVKEIVTALLSGGPFPAAEENDEQSQAMEQQQTNGTAMDDASFSSGLSPLASDAHQPVLFASFFESQLGGKKLECGGHLYRRSRHRGDSIYWRCDQNRRYRCAGSARTVGETEGTEVELGKPHNHAPCPARCAAQRLTRQIRQTALAAGGCLPPRAVIDECLAGASDDVRAALPHVESLKRAVSRKRRSADNLSGINVHRFQQPTKQQQQKRHPTVADQKTDFAMTLRNTKQSDNGGKTQQMVEATVAENGQQQTQKMHSDSAGSSTSSVVPCPAELALCRQAVLVNSDQQQQQQLHDYEQRPVIVGYDFNAGIQWEALLDSFLTTGFQASHMGIAIQEINAMIEERSVPVQFEPGVDPFFDYPQPNRRRRRRLTIFLGYTSNLVTSGLRETFRYLLEHDQVDCVVTSAGGVEEDIIKCLRPTYLGSFKMPGNELRAGGINRAGNLLIPNSNYCAFEEWLNPILDKCLEEQRLQGTRWTPSKLIARLGSEIGDKRSICYWAWHNRIPIFCPALTDGSLGDMLYFHSVKNGGDGIVLDIVEDLRYLNTMAVRSLRTGVIILGGGVVKHHINNANLMRNGSDRTVYINSGQEFDGSDSGAEPDEAVSWGKVKGNARAVKVCADATLVFPLIVARTFARAVTQRQKCRGERSEGGGEKGHQQHQQDNQRQLERID